LLQAWKNEDPVTAADWKRMRGYLILAFSSGIGIGFLDRPSVWKRNGC